MCKKDVGTSHGCRFYALFSDADRALQELQEVQPVTPRSATYAMLTVHLLLAWLYVCTMQMKHHREVQELKQQQAALQQLLQQAEDQLVSRTFEVGQSWTKSERQVTPAEAASSSVFVL
jgi:hypothetical protein